MSHNLVPHHDQQGLYYTETFAAFHCEYRRRRILSTWGSRVIVRETGKELYVIEIDLFTAKPFRTLQGLRNYIHDLVREQNAFTR